MIALVLALLALCVAVYGRCSPRRSGVHADRPGGQLVLAERGGAAARGDRRSGHLGHTRTASWPPCRWRWRRTRWRTSGHVSARLLPKSCFGERYVALEPRRTRRPRGSGRRRDPRDAAATPSERQVFNHLLPLCRRCARRTWPTTWARWPGLSGGARTGDTITAAQVPVTVQPRPCRTDPGPPGAAPVHDNLRKGGAGPDKGLKDSDHDHQDAAQQARRLRRPVLHGHDTATTCVNLRRQRRQLIHLASVSRPRWRCWPATPGVRVPVQAAADACRWARRRW